jgi:hypothetical protein
MDLGKVLTVGFDYELVSGTLNFSGTLGSQTLMVYIYDATAGGASWIQPAGYLGMNQSSGPGRVTATFQTSVVAGQKYRIAVIASQAVGSACSLEFDNFVCSRVNAPIGPVVTDWVSYTPTVTYNSGSATNVSHVGRWRRVGDSIEIDITSTFSNTSAAFSRPTYSLPSGLSFDTSKLPSNEGTKLLGYGEANDILTNSYPLTVGYNSTNTFFVFAGNASTTYLSFQDVTNTIPFTFNNTDTINVRVSAPISGWSSSVQMSNDTDTRVVAMRATVSAGQTFTAVAGGSANKLTYGSVTSDTHGAYNSTTSTYTIPVSGYYRFQAMLYLNAVSQASGNFNEISATINGGAISFRLSRLLQYLVNGDISLNGSSIYYLSAGSTVEFYWGPGAITTATKVLDQGLNYISIERLSGPSVIAASEVVEATYQALAGNVMNNGTEMWLDYGTKIRDTHNAVSGAGSGNKTVSNAGWKFTAPITGRYYVNAVFHVTSGAVANSVTYGYIAVNGAAKSHSDIKAGQNPAGDAFGSQINGEVFMNAGDYLEIVGYQANGANRNQQVVNIRNQVEIVRVGAY